MIKILFLISILLMGCKVTPSPVLFSPGEIVHIKGTNIRGAIVSRGPVYGTDENVRILWARQDISHHPGVVITTETPIVQWFPVVTLEKVEKIIE